MLTIRLTRKGKKNQPFFRVVVIDKRRSSKGGRAVEDLGYKNPLAKKISLNKERVLYWISKGAQPSSTVHNLLVSEKIIESKKIHVSKISKKKQAEIAKARAKAEEEAKARAAAAPAEKSAEASAEPAKSPEDLPAQADNQVDKKPAEPEKSDETAKEPAPSEEKSA